MSMSFRWGQKDICDFRQQSVSKYCIGSIWLLVLNAVRKLSREASWTKSTGCCFQTFTRSVYCFPDPTSGKQALIISAIGYSENQMSEYYIRMTDLEKYRRANAV